MVSFFTLRKYCFIILILSCFSLFADEENGDTVILPAHETVNDDYFVHGKNVEILGTINGDLYVFGGQIYIEGVINGDVLIAGGSVDISGKVSDDVRIIGGQVHISGHVRKNVTAFAATIELAPEGSIGGNVFVIAGNVDLESKIFGHARVYASTLRLGDQVAGNVKAYVGQMRVTARAEIGGMLEYWSNKVAIIDGKAKIQGGVNHHPSFIYQFLQGKFFKSLKIGSKLVALLMNFFYSLIIGLIMIRYFPQRIERTITVLNTKPIQALIAGIVLLILLPLACLILLISIVGVPFALTLLAINVISFYTVKILFIIWISKHIFRRFDFYKHIRMYFTCGLFVYTGLTLIPYAGIVVSIGALLFGLGGLILSKAKN